MTAFAPYFIPQYRTTTLDKVGGLNVSETTGIKLADVPADLDIADGGILALTYSNPIDSTKIEWITYTSIDGTNVLQGVTRGAEGWSAKTHLNGCTIAWVVSKSHINELMHVLTGITTGAYLSGARITRRIVSAATATTHTIDADATDIFVVTAQGGAATIAAPTGTPVQGQTLIIRIKDNGTARALTWNDIFREGDVTLPTTTVISKTLYCCFIYNSTDTKWDLMAYIDNI